MPNHLSKLSGALLTERGTPAQRPATDRLSSHWSSVGKFGHETNEPAHCRGCGNQWTIPREKATDINLALAAYQDASDDIYDAAFIVTADTDQAATFAFIKERFPNKKLFTVTPPGREPSKYLTALADGKIKITERMLDDSALPAIVGTGVNAIIRPVEYDPPLGWVHPSLRP
jgi:hypothetical protein